MTKSLNVFLASNADSGLVLVVYCASLLTLSYTLHLNVQYLQYITFWVFFFSFLKSWEVVYVIWLWLTPSVLDNGHQWINTIYSHSVKTGDCSQYCDNRQYSSNCSCDTADSSQICINVKYVICVCATSVASRETNESCVFPMCMKPQM